MNMAEALLQNKGFNGFSYAHIATELGVRMRLSIITFPPRKLWELQSSNVTASVFNFGSTIHVSKSYHQKKSWIGFSAFIRTCAPIRARFAWWGQWRLSSIRFLARYKLKSSPCIRNYLSGYKRLWRRGKMQVYFTLMANLLIKQP